MAQFKKYLFEKLFDMSTGYVLDFYNISFASFIEESVRVNIYDLKYSKYGDSKGKRLKAFFDIEDNVKVGKLLKDMLDYYPMSVSETKRIEESELFEQCKKEIEILLNGAEFYTDKLNFVETKGDLTLTELKTSVETDLNNSRFNAALDRLHTYCMNYFRTKAKELSLTIEKDKPLHSIAGDVLKVIGTHQSEMTNTMLKSSLSVLDKYNKVRNDHSLAHDNEILNNSEAKLISEWIINFLGFFEECFDVYILKIKKVKLDDDEVPF